MGNKYYFNALTYAIKQNSLHNVELILSNSHIIDNFSTDELYELLKIAEKEYWITADSYKKGLIACTTLITPQEPKIPIFIGFSPLNPLERQFNNATQIYATLARLFNDAAHKRS